MNRFLGAFFLLTFGAATQAQSVRALMVGAAFSQPAPEGHLRFVQVEFWSGASKTAQLKTQLAPIDLGTEGRDFRDIKSVKFIDGPGSPSDLELTEFALFGIPNDGPAGIGPGSGTLDVTKIKGDFEPARDRPQTSTVVSLSGLHQRFDSEKKIVFNLSREGMADEPKMYSKLDVHLRVNDGCRRESRLKFFIETIDSQLIELPNQWLRDGENRDFPITLSVPIPENGIRRIHAWFSNREWTDNRSQGVGDIFQDDDDANVTISITGQGKKGSGPLARTILAMVDWRNNKTRELSTLPQTYPDMYITNLDFLLQTGANKLHYDPNSLPSAKCYIEMNRGVELIRHTTGTFVQQAAGGAFRGSFEDRGIARAFTQHPLREGFRLSDINELKIGMDFGIPFPRDYRGSFTETWDLAALLVRAVPRGPSSLDRPVVFCDFAYNQQMKLNLNVSGGGSSYRTIRLNGTPIKYRATVAPGR